MTLDSQIQTCLCLLNDDVKGICHYTQPEFPFILLESLSKKSISTKIRLPILQSWKYLCQAPVHFPSSLIVSVLLPATFPQSFSGQVYSCSLIIYYNNGYIYIISFSLMTRFGGVLLSESPFWNYQVITSVKCKKSGFFRASQYDSGSHSTLLKCLNRHCWRS